MPTVKKLFSLVKQTMYQYTGAGPTAVAWVAIRDFGGFAVNALKVTGTGDATLIIQAATDSSGSNPATVASRAIDSSLLVNSYVPLEIVAQQVQQLAETNGVVYTHVSAVLTLGTGGDVMAVTYTLSAPRFAYDALTAAYISA